MIKARHLSPSRRLFGLFDSRFSLRLLFGPLPLMNCTFPLISTKLFFFLSSSQPTLHVLLKKLSDESFSCRVPREKKNIFSLFISSFLLLYTTTARLLYNAIKMARVVSRVVHPCRQSPHYPLYECGSSSVLAGERPLNEL